MGWKLYLVIAAWLAASLLATAGIAMLAEALA